MADLPQTAPTQNFAHFFHTITAGRGANLSQSVGLKIFPTELFGTAQCWKTRNFSRGRGRARGSNPGALKMADLRRLATTCDDLRRLATTCDDLRRLASVDFQNLR
jgi:hypothetical protein